MKYTRKLKRLSMKTNLIKYKIIFETSGILSNNQIAEILNAIQPKSVFDHQQASGKLIIKCSFSSECDVDDINCYLDMYVISFAKCTSIVEI